MSARFLIFILCFSVLTGCTSPDASGEESEGSVDMTDPIVPDADAVSYMDMYDAAADLSYFSYPQTSVVPDFHWTCVNVQNRGDRNNLGLESPGYGLQYHLLAQSLAGLVNRAMDAGEVRFGMWLETGGSSYGAAKANLGAEIGRQTAIELATKTYSPYEGVEVDVKSLIDGYVLTDVENNPESNIVATVASHVYNSIIVDVRDKEIFDNAGYVMTYDAREKSTRDAWKEFKDKCSNKALVVMPVQTGELREFAIKNNLFIINLNRSYGTSSNGQNSSLFDEVLAWLEPNAPVLGWEQGVGEDQFVSKVSRYGSTMLPADWSYNHSLTSAGASARQEQKLAYVINPREIDYDVKKNYVSFFLSDGDNYQWVMGDGFVNSYYGLAAGASSSMSYGMCSQSLCQLSPDRFDQLYLLQRRNSTIMECFGGGYFYADTYSTAKGNRAENLKILAERTAKHMRQHRLKVLHLMAMDWESSAAKETYQAFIDANDQLEGIVTIEYAPYSGGRGKVQWFTNKAGYDIPVVSARYAIWKDLTNEGDGIGNPKEVAEYIRKTDCASEESFSAVVVHAWSDFSGYRAGDAALSCLNQAPATVEAVNVQELIWRIRMNKRPEQTKKFLKTIK